MNAKVLTKLKETNDICFNSMITVSTQVTGGLNVLKILNDEFKKANIDTFFYSSIEKELLNGNFSVLYLDNRMVGQDKKRKALQSKLNKFRSQMIKMQLEGKTTMDILFTK